MGLKHIFSGASAAASSASKAGTGFLSDTNKWAFRLVFAAGVATVLKKAGLDIPQYAVFFAAALGIAALMYESTASRDMLRAFWHGRPVSAMCALLVWACAFGYSINNWVGVASENQAEKTNIHRTAFNASSDTRKAVKDLEAHLTMLTGKYDWTKNLDAPDAYEARIKAAESDAAYEATRNGCKSKCIAKQQQAANLRAEQANAKDRAVTAEEIKGTQAKLDAARAVATNTKVENSEARNDLLILTTYAGMTEQSAQIFNGLFSILVVSLFISFGSMRAELDELRKEGPRRKLHLFARFRHMLASMWDGEAKPFQATDAKAAEVHNHVTISDAVAVETLRKYAQQMRNAVAPLNGPKLAAV